MKSLFSIQLAPSMSKLGNIGHDLIWRRICLEMEGATTVPASLLRWITPDETAAEFFRRQSREAVATGLPFIDAHVKLRPGNILELAGPAGSAKSEMLLQMVAHCLCSTANVQPGQEQEHVVLVDCDGKFDTLRLLQVLQLRAPGCVPVVMPRFHLVRCFNTLELLLALTTLPQQLATLKGCCRLLLVDNIAANVWHDRAAVFSSSNQQLPFPHQQHISTGHIPPQQQQPWPGHSNMQQQQQGGYTGYTPAGHPNSSSGMQEGQVPGFDALRVQRAVAALLQAVSQQWRVPVVVSKQAGVQQLERAGVDKLVQREVLTESLQTAVTHRLLLMPAGSQSYQQDGNNHLGAVVLAQWQAGDFTGPLQRCLIRSDAVQLM